MDPHRQIWLTLSCVVFTLIVFIYFRSKKASIVPEVDGAWPIIGHLHHLGNDKLFYKTLCGWADKYGPVFTIRLGSHRALVVNNREMAKECCTVHDKVFSDRPNLIASEILGYNYAMFGFAPYGSYWREMRKITTIELMSKYRLDMLKRLRAAEVDVAVKQVANSMKRKGSNLVDMKQWFGDLTHNFTVRMMGGKRYFGGEYVDAESVTFQKSLGDFFYLFGVFVVSDVIPFLGWLDFGGYKKAMKKTGKELDAYVGGWLKEHRRKRRELSNEVDGKNEERDFMDVMMTIIDGSEVSGLDADTVIKATCLNMIIGASDSSMVTLTWALSLLLNNPKTLKKVQAELDIHVGRDRIVDESDIQNLVYLQAVVKETFRLYPPFPVLGLREAIEDCTLSNGYHVKAGTRLIVNAWRIHRDPSVWSNPNEFQPERFLTTYKDVDVKGQDFELIPFNAGRRACSGITLALQILHLSLASLLHCFEVATQLDQQVDMTETPGLTNMKATPLEALLTPRLDPKFYGQ